MFWPQYKFTRHTKNRKCDLESRKTSAEINLEMSQMLQLAGKDFKEAYKHADRLNRT